MASTLLSKSLVSSAWPFHQQRSQVSDGVRRRHNIRPSPLISCKGGRDADSAGPFIDRRNVLIGLGGLYGATSGVGYDAAAFPVLGPDLSRCKLVDFPSSENPTNCCLPPFTGEINYYQLPPTPPTPRVRLAAQNAAKDEEYMKKFTDALTKMKGLPEDDPRSFQQQAKVHCAYCNGAYFQKNYADVELQVHSSWLFFPFHRWYLYFFERILANLANDESFTIPFWNWDAPIGMSIPSIYNDPSSPLYDDLRNPAHLPPKIIDLNYGGCDPITDDEKVIQSNLVIMRRQMSAIQPSCFMGNPYRAGDSPRPGAGTLEHVPHNTIHNWTGDPCETNGEDMGTFYSAARDPIFYAHHANVDRMWNVWKEMDATHKDFTDTDWLDTEFVFYDETKAMVKVKVRDCLDSTKLGYKYEDVEIPWRDSLPTKPIGGSKGFAKKKAVEGVADVASVFPRKLNKVVHAIVRRPMKKEGDEEVLLISAIEVRGDEFVKFDVYINVDDHKKHGPASSTFAGSFVHVPHHPKHSKTTHIIKTNMRLPITEVLKDLQVEDGEEVVVTLVPRNGKDSVTVGGVLIGADMCKIIQRSS